MNLRTSRVQMPVQMAALALLASLAAVSAAQSPPWLDAMAEAHGLEPGQVATVQEVLAGSRWISQGNPAITQHPMTPDQCRTRRAAADGLSAERLASDAKICGGPHMAPLYDPSKQTPGEAQACIDRYEFPDVPCEYPLIWTRASEAAALCEAVGRRLCDAHEWEGACAGALEPPDYRFDLAAGRDANSAVKAIRDAHNNKYRGSKSWAYSQALGVQAYTAGVCAAASTKSPGCDGGNFAACGSNTYPAGAFPSCVSPLGVYDLHGNAAEHMNLPLAPDQLASGSAPGANTKLGVTEMKGSWFIFDSYYAHEDWCRWRAPYWHGSRVRDAESHHNYHLGFRCCRTVGGGSDPASQTH